MSNRNTLLEKLEVYGELFGSDTYNDMYLRQIDNYNRASVRNLAILNYGLDELTADFDSTVESMKVRIMQEHADVLVTDLTERQMDLVALQCQYPTFKPFLKDVIEGVLRFRCTALQEDIGDFLDTDIRYLMVQAQRGQAKTTIAAAYAVYQLIHDPSSRTLIMSAAGGLASEISNWVIQIIKFMPVLDILRPDRNAGDRASVEAFDIHWELKGPEKSPSVACMGITSAIQGRRADFLIADDVESSKNSLTELQRENLRHLTRDFISICSQGRILYLGTPQSSESIYNDLPGRGFTVRIWPGRYPSEKELDNYGDLLAPIIRDAIEADPTVQTGGGPTGTRGKPTDPQLFNEETLTYKEIDQGPSYFQLQHMLDTRLSDASRYPLKAEYLLFMDLDSVQAPSAVEWKGLEQFRFKYNVMGRNLESYNASGVSDMYQDYQAINMYVDPAGGGKNGDETAYAVTAFLNGFVYVLDVGAVPGGYDEQIFITLSGIAAKWKVNRIEVEQNYGNGAFAQMWRPVIGSLYGGVQIEDVFESGQKELRIIDTLEPVMARHRLIFDRSIVRKDAAACQVYAIQHRQHYSLFNQLTKITRDRDALIHDDRLDALAGAVRYWIQFIAIDADKAQQKERAKQHIDLMANPLQRTEYTSVSDVNRRGTARQVGKRTPSRFGRSTGNSRRF